MVKKATSKTIPVAKKKVASPMPINPMPMMNQPTQPKQSKNVDILANLLGKKVPVGTKPVTAKKAKPVAKKKTKKVGK